MASTATIKFWPKVLISQTTTVGEGEGRGEYFKLSGNNCSQMIFSSRAELFISGCFVRKYSNQGDIGQ